MTTTHACPGIDKAEIKAAERRRDLKRELRSYGIHHISGPPLREWDE